MSETAESVFRRTLVLALWDLLREYGSPPLGDMTVIEPSPATDARVAGIIGFTESRFGGFVAIQTYPEVVAKILPEEIRGRISERVIADWMGELSNQLLGRTKNKMLRYGVSFQMSPPTSVSGLMLNITPHDAGSRAWMEVETEAGPLQVLVDFRSEHEVCLVESDDSAAVAVSEGDMMLF